MDKLNNPHMAVSETKWVLSHTDLPLLPVRREPPSSKENVSEILWDSDKQAENWPCNPTEESKEAPAPSVRYKDI